MSTTKTKQPKQAKRVRAVVEYEVSSRDDINAQAAMIHVASGCQPATGRLIELRKPRVDIAFKGMDFDLLRKIEVSQTLMAEKLSSITEHLASIDPTGEESKRLVEDARGLLVAATYLNLI